MLQDIEPRVFYNEFQNKQADLNDLFLVYKGDNVLVGKDKDKLWYPSFRDFSDSHPHLIKKAQFLLYDKDRLLMTKYANRKYQKYALIAGFNEIGESLEQTIRREVMEEVGVKVKNIRYYKSQPWPFTDTLLAGYFAELDGDDTIYLDEEELAIGIWMPREEIPEQIDSISLTGEMIEEFRKNRTHQ